MNALRFVRWFVLKRIPIAILLSLATLCAPTVESPAKPAAQAAALAPGWMVECADCPKYFYGMRDRSLQADPWSGFPYVAYGGDHLYYAEFVGTESSWQVTTVDEALGVGAYAALALDESRNAHISYYDELNGHLKYAYQDESGWHIQVLDQAEDVGLYTSIALDGAGYVHISYLDQTRSDLKYAHRDEVGWHIETLDGEGNVGMYSSLALDDSGYAHISYYADWPDENLKYAYQDAGGWHILQLTDGVKQGRYSSLALDANGYAHISYYDAALENLRYTYQDASGWHDTLVAESGNVGSHCAIGVDGDGYPHIVYSDEGESDLEYAYKDASGWHFQTLDSEGSAAYSSIDVDSAGWIHVSYLKNSIHDLYHPILSHISRFSFGWHADTVDHPGQVGWFTSLELDGSGYARISYMDWGQRELRESHRNASGWQWGLMFGEGDAGWYSSLALDNRGFGHISYIEAYTQELKYAEQTEHPHLGWAIETVTSLGANGGRDTSLALDDNGYPHIIYTHNLGFGDVNLMHAYQDATGWHTEVVDANGGAYASLVIAGGHLHVAYVNGPVYYAYQDASGWHLETVDNTVSSAEYTSLALDRQGQARISYYDSIAQDLRYASRDASGWHSQTVDSEGRVGEYNSLAVASSGYAQISYHDDTKGALKYANEDASGWHLETVVSAGHAGEYTSLELSPYGAPRISFYIGSPAYDLMFASLDVYHYLHLPLIRRFVVQQ